MGRFFRQTLIAILLAATAIGARLAAAQDTSGRPQQQIITGADGKPVIVLPEIAHDLSPALRDIPDVVRKKEPPKESHDRVPQHLPHGKITGNVDPVVQTSVPKAPLMPSPALNFEGQGTGFAGFSMSGEPPDTNGDVGLNNYVQIVNTEYAVFDKSGNTLQGPKNINSVWHLFGGGCEANNDGDPVVKYDKRADRWIITQFSVSSTPYTQCIAVSTTGDPTGTYNRYAFAFNNTDFNDYPKLGVWPDAYYETYNIFLNGASFSDGRVCAYDRTKMLAGLAATGVCKSAGSTQGGLLPSDLDGATDPPAGAPNYVVNYDTNSLNIWQFHVDFAVPANSTFTGPTNVAVAAFSALCGGGTCIPQPGTGQQLDSLADRLMFRLAYRNFGTHESLVVNHSVSASGGGGIRWYEIRSPGASPTIFQQGTFAPDSGYRWMGSVAMDQSGNLAAGYSLSSSTTHPAILYTGRLSTDPLGTLPQGEVTLFAGTGSQSGHTRWGDYSAMAVDPSDDCTFWYTTEYMPTGSNDFDWHTRIGSFKYPNCGLACPTPPTASASGDATICPGGSTPLSGSGGVSCTWNPATGLDDATSCTPNASPSATTIYTLAVTDGTGCTSANNPTVTVTVRPRPLAVASGTATICAGNSTPLSGSGGVGCTWNPATGLDDASSCTPNASPASSQTYTLTVVDANGCVSVPTPGAMVVGFESGDLSGWTIDSSTPAPTVSTVHAHSGTYSALLGTVTGASEPNGDSAMHYQLMVPAAGGAVGFWYWPLSQDTVTYDWQEADITDTSGTILATIMHTADNDQAWKNVSFDVTPYAGQTIWIKFLVHQDGYGDITGMYVDDVSLPMSVGPSQAVVTVAPAVDTTVTAPASVPANSTGNIASVAENGATYAWSIAGATITSATNTQSITFTAGSTGSVFLQVTVSKNGCSAGGSQTVSITGSIGSAIHYYTIAPCRVVDTRQTAGMYGGPALLGDGATRDFPITGQCAIPSDAYAVSANMTVVNPSGAGDLRIFPTGSPSATSAINFNAGSTRANNAIVPLTGTPLGSMTIQCDIPAGSSNLLVDINGYFK